MIMMKTGWMLLLVLTLEGTARAQAPAAAEALFDAGRVALAVGDFETACARFRESDRLDPAIGTKANIGSCEAKRGRVATAWEVLRGAVEKLPAGDERVRLIREALAVIEPRIPHLVLQLAPGAPAGTTVSEGGTVFGTAGTYGVSLPFDPGVHHLLVAIPGQPQRALDVVLIEGKTVTLAVGELALAPLPVQQTPVKGPPPAPVPSRASPGPWIVGGLGLAGILVGSVMGALVVHDKSVTNAHCTNGPPPTCRDQAGLDAAAGVRMLGPVTTAGLMVGAAGIAGGAIWLGVREGGKQRARIGIAPMASGAACRLEGSW